MNLTDNSYEDGDASDVAKCIRLIRSLDEVYPKLVSALIPERESRLSVRRPKRPSLRLAAEAGT